MATFSRYRTIGYNAVPVKSKTKTQFLCKWGQYQEKMPEMHIVQKWDKWKCNVALICGRVSGVIVLDVDNLSLLEKYPPLPKTVTTISRQGKHFHFKYFESPYGFKSEIEPKLEVKSDKKTVHLPPSIHPTGFKYRFENSPSDTELAELPEEWKELIRRERQPIYEPVPPHKSGGWAHYISSLYATGKGNRNNELNRISYLVGSRLRTAGEMPYAELELLQAARAIGLSDSESKATIRGAIRKGLQNVR